MDVEVDNDQPPDSLSILSDEVMCHILSFLPLRQVLHLSRMCRRLRNVVRLHLHLRKSIDLNTEGKVIDYMPASMTDNHLIGLMKYCKKLEYVYGLHPYVIYRRRRRGQQILSIPGVIEALYACPELKGVETCNIQLLESILQQLPHVNIVGQFRNRDGHFPIIPGPDTLHLPPCPLLTGLHLTGVDVPQLPPMPGLVSLSLLWVRFSHLQPFRGFSAPGLRTFVMRHCAGPPNPFKYLPLVVALSNAPALSRLELARVPLMGGMLRRVVADSRQNGGFRNLEDVTISTCKQMWEIDLGYLVLVSACKLSRLRIQPSLCKDSLMTAIRLASPDFGAMRTLHLGHIDVFPDQGAWTEEELILEGLVDGTEYPTPISDIGIEIVGTLFPRLISLQLYWCPHLSMPTMWIRPETRAWNNLKELIIRRCYLIFMEDFLLFISNLPVLENLVLDDVFPAPPPGCSHVGLSTGTSIGLIGVPGEQHPVAHLGDAMNQEVQNHHLLPNAAAGVYNVGGEDGGPVAIPGPSGLSHRYQEVADHTTNHRQKPDSVCSCSCQASFDEIREVMKSATGPTVLLPQPDTAGNSAGRSQQSVASRTRAAIKRRGDVSPGASRTDKRSMAVCDKSTSTSDPVLCDENPRVLQMLSDSLVSFTILNCGVTDIDISQCPQLTHLEVRECTSLQGITFDFAPNLERITVANCVQADLVGVVGDVVNLPAICDRLVYLLPGKSRYSESYNCSSLEKALLKKGGNRQHVLLVEAATPTMDDRDSDRRILQGWLRTFHKINCDALKQMTSYHVNGNNSNRLTYPWNRDIYWMYLNQSEMDYRVCTDVPWLRYIWSNLPEYIGRDLPRLNRKMLLPQFQLLKADIEESGSPLHPHTVGVLVQNYPYNH